MKNLYSRLERLEMNRIPEHLEPQELIVHFVAPDQHRTVIATERFFIEPAGNRVL